MTSNGFLCCQHDWSLLLNWQKNIWRQKQSRFSSNPTDKIWYTVCLHSFITLASFEGLVVSLACLLLQRFYFVSHKIFYKSSPNIWERFGLFRKQTKMHIISMNVAYICSTVKSVTCICSTVKGVTCICSTVNSVTYICSSVNDVTCICSTVNSVTYVALLKA